MNIQFDSASLTAKEALALTAFLSVLHGQAQPNIPAQPATLHEQLKASVEQATPVESSNPGPVLVEQAEPTGRKRRTKAEIAADEAAKQQQPPTVGDRLMAAEAARKEAVKGSLNVSEAGDVEVAAPVNGATKIDADQLRGLLNGYIARHSMEDAIEKLRAFGCNRVTEALALESDKLSQLAATLNG